MATQAKSQLALDEEIIENPDLEAALEERQKRHDSLAAVTAKYREADDKAKAAIALLELPEDHVVRVGRFRIAAVTVPAKSVSFETDESRRLQIKADES